MLMPEFNVLADVTKCVSEQRAAEKSFHLTIAPRLTRSPRRRGRAASVEFPKPSAFAVITSSKLARSDGYSHPVDVR
jgi:hypothetical protein